MQATNVDVRSFFTTKPLPKPKQDQASRKDDNEDDEDDDDLMDLDN